MGGTLRIIVLQRHSHVADGAASLSVEARLTEMLDFLSESGLIRFAVIDEGDPNVKSAVEWCHILLLNKHSSPEALMVALHAKGKGKRIVYDMDDWIFGFPSYSQAQGAMRGDNRIEMILQISDMITVANRRIQEKLGASFENVVLVPNGIFVDKYNPSGPMEQREDPKRILFANADNIKLGRSKEGFLSLLQAFFLENDDYFLDFVGDPFPELYSMPFVHYTKRLAYAHFMEALVKGEYTFAIVPLGSSEDAGSYEFNACKNPFKYLNFGTACIPGIYSDNPIYTEVIRNGATGILVPNGEAEWREAIAALAGSPSLRSRIARDAYYDIRENHDIKRSASVFLDRVGDSLGLTARSPSGWK